MKVTEFNEELLCEIKETSLFLIRAINLYREKHGVTHRRLAEQMLRSQGTVSKILSEKNVDEKTNKYGNLSVSEARKICKAMGTTLGVVLSEYEQQFAQYSADYAQKETQEYTLPQLDDNIPAQCGNVSGQESTIYPACLFSENDSLTNDISDPMFRPWFGKYYCYFFSTLSNEHDCFEGKLEIPEETGNGCCYVRFGFVYDQEENLRKEYYGQLVLSKKQNGGAYCTLINHDDQGEITYLVNARRQSCRVELMEWSRQLPDEFYKLFLKFSSVNDPQIRSDMFSILMSLLFEDENTELINTAAKWLMENILAPDKIEENRDIAIRYYSTSIVRKAASLNIVDLETALQYLPPFIPMSDHIALSEEAIAGTYMGGYGGISYDLGRYVLINHITGVFPENSSKAGQQYEKLIERIAENCPQFADISPTQFILSAAYEFISIHGWNEEFRYHEIDGKKISGVDWAISGSHWPKTHGSQSPVMTICEKYVWQARNYISGFLADRLMYVDEGGASYIDDYGLLDDFLIPALEMGQIAPDGMNDLYPWHIPERDVVIISGKPNSCDDVIQAVQTAPDITWKRWIEINNANRQYPIDADELIALSGYSCFECSAGVETNLYLSAILIATSDVDTFIKKIKEDSDLSYRAGNPPDWKGGCSVNCYVTPKEMCWMPWKKRCDSCNIYDFPELKIHSAVDKCTSNSIEYGDVCYEIPSAPIREILKISNTDGYLFYDGNKRVKVARVFAGESWRTQQCYLLVDKVLLQDVEQTGNTLLWIMREDRRENVKAKERFGNFYAEKDNSYVGFFNKGEFIVVQIFPRKGPEADMGGEDNPLSDILDQYGYETESSEDTEQLGIQEVEDSSLQ